jgi:hypothetical protein
VPSPLAVPLSRASESNPGLRKVELSARRIIFEWIGSVRRNVLRGLAHDLYNLGNHIAPIAADGGPEQISNRSVDRYLGISIASGPRYSTSQPSAATAARKVRQA